MSHDLMVFDPSAPRYRAEFIAWYEQQTQWSEEHGYNDVQVCSAVLQAWYAEIIQTFPDMNGMSDEEFDESRATDYSLGTVMVYAAFAWSQAQTAHETVTRLAQKHGVGFFDVSATDGVIVFPGEDE
ncbi:hypothetical protein [Deinococcus sp. AJ005]|uniref:hypothetical protein n=1 Tax=Deinococcus sp. AJ005 TaxID=2652443 RepID=UPI00125CB46F|nr:hypothetical protein [Deinococcus sp. AJ005]QFP76891.1 hypothetical protein DAAJ005_10830 [Deinococcus sp. AJ005]